jgi:hypothetical protein
MIFELALHQPGGLVDEHLILYPDLQIAGTEKDITYKTPATRHAYIPTCAAIRPRASRFPADRKGCTIDPLALLWTCKQFYEEAKPIFWSANDLVAALFSDKGTPSASVHRDLAIHENAMAPLVEVSPTSTKEGDLAISEAASIFMMTCDALRPSDPGDDPETLLTVLPPYV